jgi:hypothetical protein
MNKTAVGVTTRRKDLRARLKIAEVELSPLLEDVRRDRDRLAANSLTLRFVWQPEEHPYPGKLWELGYGSASDGYWCEAGHFFGKTAVPTTTGSTPYDCKIYLVRGDGHVYERFTQHCREAEAIFGRMAGDGTRFNWANELFETFRECVDEEDRYAVEWRENEKPDHPETWSYIADFTDVLEWTRLLVETFRDRAKFRQRLLGGPLLDDEGNPLPPLKLKRTDAELGDKASFAFQPDGDGYFVRGFGERGHVTAKGVKGLHDIFRLVQTPGVLTPMLELDGGVGTNQLHGDRHSRQPVANCKTRRDIGLKRSQLVADIENADTDLERDELREELENLDAGTRSMYGLRGKARDLNNPTARLRAKLLARKSRACKHLMNSGLTKLAGHLDCSIGSEGDCLVYRSTTQNIAWDTEPKV